MVHVRYIIVNSLHKGGNRNNNNNNNNNNNENKNKIIVITIANNNFDSLLSSAAPEQ